MNLSRRQRQRLTAKKAASALRGALKRKEQRIRKTEKIRTEAIKEIAPISNSDLFILGVALYWAEGAKEKNYGRGQGIIFSNSDPKMVVLFLKWLREIVKIGQERIKFDIYVQESYKDRVEEIKSYWSHVTGLAGNLFERVYSIIRKAIPTRREETLGMITTDC